MDYIQQVYENIDIREGIQILENYLIEVYSQGRVSNKELAQKISLPIPIVVAIKNEFIKLEILTQDRGIRMTDKGLEYIENELKYRNIDKKLWFKILNDDYNLKRDFQKELSYLQELFADRPTVDVTLDQSKCTPETSLKRAILALKYNSLIGKRVLCVGDDDLVSISIGVLLKRLYKNFADNRTKVKVIDIDERILDYINEISETENLDIATVKVDLRDFSAGKLKGGFDCLFLDPPYTLAGMKLFLGRGLSLLKKKSEQFIFLSFAPKFPEFNLKMQKAFNDWGLIIKQIIPNFNKYEGSSIIGSEGRMIVLQTTSDFKQLTDKKFNTPIYTGEINEKTREYKCKVCNKIIKLDSKADVKTIEQLKKQGCPRCQNNTFELYNSKLKERRV